MTKLAVDFRDPQSAAKLDCDGFIADAALSGAQPSFLANLGTGTKLPLVAPQAPFLVVRSGAWIEYLHPISAVNRIRVVAYSQDPDEAWDIASWMHGRMLAFPGDDDVLSYRYDAAPQRDVDGTNATPFAAFTVAARMRWRSLDALPVPVGGFGSSGFGSGGFGV